MLQLHHLPIPVYTIENDLVQCLSIKGFGVVYNRTDTYIILNAQCCRLQLEPFLDVMAPKAMCRVMQAFYKSTLDEAFVIRQSVDAVVVSKNLLPPVKTQRIAAKLS
ncbi:hypothetical protein ABBQ32_001209 [Trebouxia sp. C0010 RCD-2024]